MECTLSFSILDLSDFWILLLTTLLLLFYKSNLFNVMSSFGTCFNEHHTKFLRFCFTAFRCYLSKKQKENFQSNQAKFFDLIIYMSFNFRTFILCVNYTTIFETYLIDKVINTLCSLKYTFTSIQPHIPALISNYLTY